jgi:hypothetical protein
LGENSSTCGLCRYLLNRFPVLTIFPVSTGLEKEASSLDVVPLTPRGLLLLYGGLGKVKAFAICELPNPLTTRPSIFVSHKLSEWLSRRDELSFGGDLDGAGHLLGSHPGVNETAGSGPKGRPGGRGEFRARTKDQDRGIVVDLSGLLHLPGDFFRILCRAPRFRRPQSVVVAGIRLRLVPAPE